LRGGNIEEAAASRFSHGARRHGRQDGRRDNEEFKGTGNSEIHLDRRISEKRVLPGGQHHDTGTRKEE